MLSLLNSSRAVVPRTIWHSLLRQPHTRAAPVAVGSSATAQPPAGLRDTERSRRLKRARGMRSISSVGQSPFDFNPVCRVSATPSRFLRRPADALRVLCILWNRTPRAPHWARSSSVPSGESTFSTTHSIIKARCTLTSLSGS